MVVFTLSWRICDEHDPTCIPTPNNEGIEQILAHRQRPGETQTVKRSPSQQNRSKINSVVTFQASHNPL